jgi:hypothetical protein
MPLGRPRRRWVDNIEMFLMLKTWMMLMLYSTVFWILTLEYFTQASQYVNL